MKKKVGDIVADDLDDPWEMARTLARRSEPAQAVGAAPPDTEQESPVAVSPEENGRSVVIGPLACATRSTRIARLSACEQNPLLRPDCPLWLVSMSSHRKRFIKESSLRGPRRLGRS